MNKETENWLKLAKEDLDTAMYNFKGNKFKYAMFLCQQSVEKAFKAMQVKKSKKIRKIHDLVILGKDVNAPSDLVSKLNELTLAYIYARYPETELGEKLDDKAGKFLKIAKEALNWVEKNI